MVDFVSFDYAEMVILSISDHLKWDQENQHLFLLQEKINNYLEYIESGQLFEDFPQAKGCKVKISLWCKCSPTYEAKQFFNKISGFLNSFDIQFHYEIIQENEIE